MEEFLEDTPSVPSNYVLYKTTIATAVVDNDNSLFYETNVVSDDWETEVYLPPSAGGNTITPHLVGGMMTGFFDISGNGTATVTIYYQDMSSRTWYRRDVNIVGSDLAYRLEDIVNAEPGVALYISTRIYSVAGRLITKSGGQFSINNGATWTNSFVNYVPGATLYRRSVTPSSEFSNLNTFEITIGDVVKTANVITRMPLPPAFSAETFNVTVNENVSSITTIYPTESAEGLIEMSLSGDDADLFDIDDSGNISALGNLDYETPSDVGSDNEYTLTVTASNSEYSRSVDLIVTVNDVDESPPLWDNPGLITIAENIAGIWTLDLISGAAPITVSMASSLDSTKFAFIPSSRSLRFKSGMDYENPTDVNSDGTYEVDIVATNAYGSDTLRVQISVSNVIEDSTPDSVSYGVYTDRALGDSFYVIAPISGVETNAVLTVVGGELSNDNQVTWSNNVLYVPGVTFVRKQVTASDMYETTLNYSSVVNGITVAGSVRTGNTPVSMPATRILSVNEGTITSVANVAALGGYGLIQYEIVSGNDASVVRVDSTGKIFFLSSTDYYTPSDHDSDNIYTFRIRGYNSFSEAFTDVTITVLNVILPVKIPSSRYYRYTDIATTVGTIVPILTDDITTFALSGLDADLFNIDNNGNISFKAQAAYENPLDSNGDNKYLFQVVYSNSLYSSVCNVRVDIISSSAVVSNSATNVSTIVIGRSIVGSYVSNGTITGATF